MSVIASKRKESKLEAIIYAKELHNMLIDFMLRDFGVKNLEHMVQLRYAYGKDETENYSKYSYLMINYKKRIDKLTNSLVNNVRAANALYPTSMHEYEIRRDYQNVAIANCEQLMNELQLIVETFDVDVNLYSRYTKAINREIGLIKSWRQHDNRFKSQIQKQGDIC
jgi:hypothetical protein